MKTLISVLLFSASLFAQTVTPPSGGGGGGSGTVTSVSVTTANGVSGTVATATTTPAISLTLGDITPTSVSTGGTPPSLTPGTGGVLALAEGTVPSVCAASAADCIYANSTQHGLLASFNNGSYLPLVQGPASATSGHVATFNGTNGGVLQDGGVLPSFAFPITVSGTTNSGGIPYFSSTTVLTTSAAGVQNAVMAWGGAGNAPTSPLSLLVTNQNSASETWTFYNSTATTGKTTLSYKAGAGITTADPFLTFNNAAGTSIGGGFFAFNTGTNGERPVLGTRAICISDQLTAANWTSCTGAFNYLTNSGHWFGSTQAVGWINASTVSGVAGADTGIDRDAAGIIGVTQGTSGGTAANYRAIKASAHYIAGTTFTASGCSNTTLVGGATGGTFTLGANSCNVVVTMGNSATAPTGWSCRANDQTAPTILIPQSASAATTATFAIPAGAGASDVINFACLGY